MLIAGIRLRSLRNGINIGHVAVIIPLPILGFGCRKRGKERRVRMYSSCETDDDG